MKYFGWLHNAPIYQDMELAARPMGEKCGHCGEVIADTDDGFIVPGFGSGATPFHRACFLRGIIGSVAHQQSRCMCFVPGSTAEDDPALTPRQAAEAALAYFDHGKNH
jgi:hypothetical protein